MKFMIVFFIALFAMQILASPVAEANAEPKPCIWLLRRIIKRIRDNLTTTAAPVTTTPITTTPVTTTPVTTTPITTTAATTAATTVKA